MDPDGMSAGGRRGRVGVWVAGARFLMKGQPFPYTGISFFNALYNPTFNENSATRRAWLRKFRDYGINVLPLVRVIKAIDAHRLVTSSPGYAGAMGPDDLNAALDYLTPHISRQGKTHP